MRPCAVKALAMSKMKLENLRHIHTFNKGFWLAARIYSDVKGNCSCGGTFTDKQKLKNLEYPVCNKCQDTPRLFRIRAKVVDMNNQDKYIDVRHAQNGERLKDIIDCLSTLKQIENEIESGSFDIRRYDSVASRESYLFVNYSKKYLEFHAKRAERGEISPAGFKNKKKYVKVLGKFFDEIDIGTINIPLIEEFKNSFTDRFRTRDLALGELKAVLNHAHKYEVITKVPKFDLLPASTKRKEIISLDMADKIISNIADPQYKTMIKLLSIYPVRPSELRALKWSDISFHDQTVVFQRHFSDDKIMEGRKSVSSGEKSSLTYPLVPDLENYLRSIPRPFKDDYLFKGREGEFVSENCLARAWRKSTKDLRLPPYQLYELRHARLSKIAEQSNGDIVKMMKVSGHTNPKTLLERYVRTDSNLKEFFQ